MTTAICIRLRWWWSGSGCRIYSHTRTHTGASRTFLSLLSAPLPRRWIRSWLSKVYATACRRDHLTVRRRVGPLPSVHSPWLGITSCSKNDCRRLCTFNLSWLRQGQRFQETRTSPFAQPIQYHSHLQSTLVHDTPLSSSSPSATLSMPAPTSQLGKRVGPANSHVGNKKTKKITKQKQNVVVSSLVCTILTGRRLCTEFRLWTDTGGVSKKEGASLLLR